MGRPPDCAGGGFTVDRFPPGSIVASTQVWSMAIPWGWVLGAGSW